MNQQPLGPCSNKNCEAHNLRVPLYTARRLCRTCHRDHLENRRLPIVNVCEQCGQEYHPRTVDAKFCSKDCALKSLWEKAKERINVKCPECGKEFDLPGGLVERTNLNFCSIPCRAKYFREHNTGEKRRCIVCETEFDVPMSNRSKKYCSPKCRSANNKGLSTKGQQREEAKADNFSVLFEGRGLDASYNPFW